MNVAIWVVFSFLVGSFPTAYVVAKRLKGIDIREHGSGNSGATNVSRVLGKKIGLSVFIADCLKGMAPVILFYFFYTGNYKQETQVVVGFMAVLGHVFSPFLGFRGGKGVATGAGIVLGMAPFVFLASSAVWLIVYKISRTVSIASLASLAGVSIFSFFLGMTPAAASLLTAACLFVVWTHRSNIKRLLTDSENSFAKKP